MVFVDQYDAAWGQLSSALGGTCNWDAFYTRADEVMAACCLREADCPGGLPATCPIACGQVFILYYDECQDLIVELLDEDIVGFDHLAKTCLTATPEDEMFETVRALEQTGCSFPNHGLQQGGRRQLQGLNFHHGLDAPACAFVDFNDRAAAVNTACCDQASSTGSSFCEPTGNGASGLPTECDVTCGLTFIPFFEECSTIIQVHAPPQFRRSSLPRLRCRCFLVSPYTVAAVVPRTRLAADLSLLLPSSGCNRRAVSSFLYPQRPMPSPGRP